jgi:hypothetical protein
MSLAVRFRQDSAYIIRPVDLSKWGQVTGIWEIGPIVPSSSWLKKNWLGSEEIPAEPTPKGTEVYAGFCAFRYNGEMGRIPSIECLSNEFNIPGYIGPWQTEIHGAVAETWSNPGALSVTLRGGKNWWGGAVGQLGNLGFGEYPPPFEVEVGLTGPGENVPWNFHMNWHLNKKDMWSPAKGSWKPGVCNIPGEGLKAGNIYIQDKTVVLNTKFGPVFKSLPPGLKADKPVYWLARVLDRKHLQMGTKAQVHDKWTLIRSLKSLSNSRICRKTLSAVLLEKVRPTTSK